MEAIYSSVALRDRQREVKDAARKDVVHITENGNGAFIFCSEEVFERRLQRAADEALYAERMTEVVRDGRADVEAGRTFSLEEGVAAIEARRSKRD